MTFNHTLEESKNIQLSHVITAKLSGSILVKRKINMSDATVCVICTIFNFLAVIAGCLLVLRTCKLVTDITNYSSKILRIVEKEEKKRIIPFVSNVTLEQLFEAAQKELAEKDAIINWLADNLAFIVSSGPDTPMACPKWPEGERLIKCKEGKLSCADCWKEAAQEDVKKDD